ncbi:SMI1/KNR4 family protein [Ideonella oryzae]|uniref:SMI1/KNR4 family protein n=1 Tax=Ideonella oryzae TaxID=2937441 RepID=A0ABT1BQ19_9BURK|nr:SMI1/KNR4 family protein [Ideonella oryzae]MCO5978263.1 SMI1/KNR4 family protein [Ideonella oryzae]
MNKRDRQRLGQRLQKMALALAPDLPNGGLNPPATEAEMAAAEEALGLPLPAGVRQLYGMANGMQHGTELLAGYRWLPLLDPEMLSLWRVAQQAAADPTMREIVREQRKNINEAGGAVFNTFALPRRVPVATLGGDECLVLDLNPAKAGKRGQVVAFDVSDDGTPAILAGDLPGLFLSVLKNWESGALQRDAEGVWGSTLPGLSVAQLLAGASPSRRLSDDELWARIEALWCRLCPELPNGGFRPGLTHEQIIAHRYTGPIYSRTMTPFLSWCQEPLYYRHDGMEREAPPLFAGMGRWMPYEEQRAFWVVQRTRCPLNGIANPIGIHEDGRRFVESIPLVRYTVTPDWKTRQEVAPSVEHYLERVYFAVTEGRIHWDGGTRQWRFTADGSVLDGPLDGGRTYESHMPEPTFDVNGRVISG